MIVYTIPVLSDGDYIRLIEIVRKKNKLLASLNVSFIIFVIHFFELISLLVILQNRLKTDILAEIIFRQHITHPLRLRGWTGLQLLIFLRYFRENNLLDVQYWTVAIMSYVWVPSIIDSQVYLWDIHQRMNIACAAWWSKHFHTSFIVLITINHITPFAHWEGISTRLINKSTSDQKNSTLMPGCPILQIVMRIKKSVKCVLIIW